MGGAQLGLSKSTERKKWMLCLLEYAYTCRCEVQAHVIDRSLQRAPVSSPLEVFCHIVCLLLILLQMMGVELKLMKPGPEPDQLQMLFPRRFLLEVFVSLMKNGG